MLWSAVKEALSQEGGLYLLFSLLMIAAFSGILMVLKFKESFVSEGFQISNRYFIALTPIGIIAVTLFPVIVLRTLKGRTWMRAGVIVVVGFFLLFRLMRTLSLAKGLYPDVFNAFYF